MNRGIATFTLDTGHCPPWLFRRMVELGREMTRVLIEEFGPDEFIKRIADPVWFQSLGTVLAFDWNASGLTTILTAALKESIRDREKEFGIFICGGKGKTSRKTPSEILEWGSYTNLDEQNLNGLVYNSKMAAKVDSSLVQDGYQIYHHSFFFSKNGAWTVVQQGMNTENQTARRYHWYSPSVSHGEVDFVNEPHKAIESQVIGNHVLNMVSKDSDKTRETSTDLAQAGYQTLMNDIEILRRHSSVFSKTASVRVGDETYTALQLPNMEFHDHPVVEEDFTKSKYLEKILQKVTFYKPTSYEQFVALPGVGPKTVRALSLVSEILYGAKPSYEDPARYSFAHGGKDATPYPVDRQTYDQTIEIMRRAVGKSRINVLEKDKIYKKLK